MASMFLARLFQDRLETGLRWLMIGSSGSRGCQDGGRQAQHRPKTTATWASLEVSSAVLGLSWPFLGYLRAVLGLLGPSRGRLGVILGRLGAVLGLSWGSWGRLGAILGLSWGHLGAILGFLRHSWGRLDPKNLKNLLVFFMIFGKSLCSLHWMS